ncbi:MAG: DNA repair protein RadA [Clostridia bacterium]|nr:DNA repair protein RadA [Clostridia bacterium]
MARPKLSYTCTVCGAETTKWFGQCPDCGSWNTLEESAPKIQTAAGFGAADKKPLKQRGGTGSRAMTFAEIEAGKQTYFTTGISELDRVLGGGLVDGSLLLFGGEPGIGKSTLLLQVCHALSLAGKRVLYITGEESARQVKLRASRLGADRSEMLVLAENAMDQVEEKLRTVQPEFCVIDSIQTMYRPEMGSAPGSVSQVRESAALLMRYAKQEGCAMFLVGHVTKEGSLAGPRVLEHMVDVVLYFEGDRQHEYRLLRAVKNRFGSVNELGIFEMTGTGMRPVGNASETLLSQRAKGASGSCVFCGLEGSRPVLVDIQALVSQSFLAVPRRTADGMDTSRVMLLLAVMEKRARLKMYNRDCYINVAGGLSLNEPAADLAFCMAVASSYADRPVPAEWAVMGEVGLAGEVRAISQLERRVSECRRLGFTHILCPRDSARHLKAPEGVSLHGVDTVAQAMAVLDLLPNV